MSPPATGAGDAGDSSGGGRPPRELYTIPASSGWFRWDEIHETERRALPEFFGGGGFGTASRNPRIYRDYRDFIINKYREDPSRRLTFTEVRKALVGDATLLRKLFAFLDSSGLINFSATTQPQPQPSPEAARASVEVVVEAPVGLQVAPRPPASFLVGGGGGGENGFRLPPLTSYSDVFGEWAPGKAPLCGFCGQECCNGKYESLEDGMRVCSNCYKSNNDNKGDAVESPNAKKDGSDSHASNAWTDTETLLLLEGVLKHGDDWDLIAQHVRTRNKSECIARLIQLPFGEHMLGTVNGKSNNRFLAKQEIDVKMNQPAERAPSNQPCETVDCTQIDPDENVISKCIEERPLKHRRLFSSTDATDSLMKQVALLSTVAGPHVVAAAADAATGALSKENPQARKAFNLSENEYLNKSFTSNHYSQSGLEDGHQDMKMHGETITESKPEEKFSSSAYRVRAAVATAMGAAAARAKLLADQEEREMELLMASIIETQLRKIQYKIKHFEELEFIMEQEYTTIQQIKKSIIDDWLKLLGQAFRTGVPRLREEALPKQLLNKTTQYKGIGA